MGTQLQSVPQTMSYSSSMVAMPRKSMPINNTSTSTQLQHIQCCSV